MLGMFWAMRSAPFALLLLPLLSAQDDFDGKQVAAALTLKNVPPAPRLPDGRPDLGNAAGSWVPPGIGDMAGSGGGFAGTAKPDKIVDVPFLPAAKALY